MLDEAMAEFLAASNPWAQREIAERLLEASQRGLWESPDPDTRDTIERALVEAEGDVEGRSDEAAAPGTLR